jgi:hypothetical protein
LRPTTYNTLLQVMFTPIKCTTCVSRFDFTVF